MGGGILPGPAQIQGTGGGGSVPAGGTSGQLLAKLSNADQDAGWVAPAGASNNTPLVASGIGAPGVGTNYSRDDHVHPASGSGGADAYTVTTGHTPTTGDISYFPYAGGAISMFSDGRANAAPFRMTASGTFQLGVRTTSGGAAGSVIRIGVFADDAGGYFPGTLLGDLGTVVSTGTGNLFTVTGISLSSGVRYWVMIAGQGGAVSQPSLATSPTIFSPIGFDAGGNPGLRLNGGTFAGAFSSFPGFTLTSVDPNPMQMIIFRAQ